MTKSAHPIIIPKIKTAVGLLLLGLLCASFLTAFIMVFLMQKNREMNLQFLLLVAELFLPVPIFYWAWRMRTNIGELLRIKAVSPFSLITAGIVSIG